jgi:hypothetical protein
LERQTKVKLSKENVKHGQIIFLNKNKEHIHIMFQSSSLHDDPALDNDQIHSSAGTGGTEGAAQLGLQRVANIRGNFQKFPWEVKPWNLGNFA